MEQIRKLAFSSIITTGNFPIALDHFSPRIQQDRNVIEEQIKLCDILLLFLGPNYGEVMDVATINSGVLKNKFDHPISFTQFEFELARHYQKPILAFCQQEAFSTHHTISAESANYLKFISKVRDGTRFVAFWSDTDELSKQDLASKITDAIHRAMRDLEAISPKKGWVRAEVHKNQALVASALRNEFLQNAVQSLNQFEKLDERCIHKEKEKKAVAARIRELFSQVLHLNKTGLFFESGSSVAYVAQALGSELKNIVTIDGKGSPSVDIRTNNILAYLQLWLVDRVPCSTFPWGYPEEPYGGLYGPLSAFGKKTEAGAMAPVFNQNALIDRNQRLRLEIDKFSVLPFALSTSEHPLLLIGAVSGLQLSPNHEISFEHSNTRGDDCLDLFQGIKEEMNQCYGPHVGSYFNMAFKFYMYSLDIPIVIVCDADKIDCKIEYRNCHFVFDANSWDTWIREHPISFCVGCDNNNLSRTKKALECTGMHLDVDIGDASPTIFTWNDAFKKCMDKMDIWLPVFSRTTKK